MHTHKIRYSNLYVNTNRSNPGEEMSRIAKTKHNYFIGSNSNMTTTLEDNGKTKYNQSSM